MTFTRHRHLERLLLVEDVKCVKRFLARLARFDGAFRRFAGEISVERRRRGKVVEQYTDQAIWELMYFGHAKDADATA